MDWRCVPDAYRATSWGLTRKAGRIQGTEAVGGHQIVKAKVPWPSGPLRHRPAVHDGGQGRSGLEHSHYEESRPPRDKIIAEPGRQGAK